jgi:carboxyl-terminal processing protease
MFIRPIFANLVAAILILGSSELLGQTQEFTPYQREQVQQMLRDIASDVKEYYYDPKLRGVDWDAKVREAKEKIESSDAMNRALTRVAAALDSLNDSHTFFLPPPRPYSHDYGFRMQMIGDRCYVIRVRPGSDADVKGLKPGDEIVGVNGYKPTRDDFWRMEYIFNTLRPQPALQVAVRLPNASEHEFNVTAKFIQRQMVQNLAGQAINDLNREEEDQRHSVRVRYAEKGKELLIVQIPVFALSVPEVDSVVGKMRKYDSVILDLRGNPGGSVETLQYLLGAVFEKEVKIADRVTRNATTTIKGKPRHPAFTGKLTVLVDSESASASELFARVIQLEKRGSVAGDHTSRSVMESKRYVHHVGSSTMLYYGASVTEADLKMSDGNSLERIGVTPDSIVLPSSSDLATGRDPVISEAAEALGVKISPEESGTLFPFEWPKD